MSIILEDVEKSIRYISEIRAEKKRVVRSDSSTGRPVTKIKYECPDGYKLSGKNCVKMNSKEQKERSKSARKAAKTRTKNSSNQRQSMKSRSKSMEMRKKRNLD